MRTFYFNSGVKPWNTNVERQIYLGNKFINGELHHPFIVDGVPEGARLYCLTDKAVELYGSNEQYIVAKVIGGNMFSKYAVFFNN